MTVKPSVKKRCPKCIVFHRGRKLICICPENKRHRQRQG